MLLRATILLAVGAVLMASPAAAQPAFPTDGVDIHSTGRGGTVVAAGGLSSVFGNPAALRPDGQFALVVQSIDQRDAPERALALGVVDTSSPIRGAALYIKDPSFAGWEKDLWGIALCQSVGAGVTIGGSYHSGRYLAADGGEEELRGADLGLTFSLGARVAVGLLARNLYRSDEDLLPRIDGAGLLLGLPGSMSLSVDQERVQDAEAYPFLPDESRLRAGLEISPLQAFTFRLGYAKGSESPATYSGGVTYRDRNGTLDLAVAYDSETEETVRTAIGFTLGAGGP